MKNGDGCPSGLLGMNSNQPDEAQKDTSPKNMSASVSNHSPQPGMTTCLPSRDKEPSIVDLEPNFYPIKRQHDRLPEVV